MYSNLLYSKYKLGVKSFSKSVFLFKRRNFKVVSKLRQVQYETLFLFFLSPFTISVAQAYMFYLFSFPVLLLG